MKQMRRPNKEQTGAETGKQAHAEADTETETRSGRNRRRLRPNAVEAETGGDPPGEGDGVC